MPIYAYKCEACGFAKDVLQRISDAPLTDCPACAAPAFRKQLTAAGFQLKGSGWYATDFKGSGAAPPVASDKAPEGEKKADGEKKGDTPPADSSPAKPAASPAAKTDSAASS